MGGDGPAVHAGLHHGRAVFREGDCFGRAVNLAARPLGRANANEQLPPAAVASETPERGWESHGEMHLYGFSEPVEVFSLKLRAS
jgi:adenylate cyclase